MKYKINKATVELCIGVTIVFGLISMGSWVSGEKDLSIPTLQALFMFVGVVVIAIVFGRVMLWAWELELVERKPKQDPFQRTGLSSTRHER